MKLKKGDTVMVSIGRDKGHKGKIEKVLWHKQAVLISGINLSKKHLKKREGKPGEIVTITKPLNVSKVILICPKCSQPTRVGYTFVDGEKKRKCKKCEGLI